MIPLIITFWIIQHILKAEYSLDGAKYDLAERVDERLENVTGIQGAEDPTPQIQTVNKLPVIHRLIGLL